MALNYLIFDADDDGEGTGSWEAVASVRRADLLAVMAEVEADWTAVRLTLTGPWDWGEALLAGLGA